MAEQKTGLVLLVEDEPDSMAVLHETIMAISARKFRFLFASSGAEALALIQSEPVDVMVADILMPEMSGLELLRCLGEQGHFQPCIFVTSLQSRDAAISAIRLGAFDFIEKPISKEKLADPLTKAIRVSRAYRKLKHEVELSGELGSTDKLKQAAQEILQLRAMRFQSKPKKMA